MPSVGLKFVFVAPIPNTTKSYKTLFLDWSYLFLSNIVSIACSSAISTDSLNSNCILRPSSLTSLGKDSGSVEYILTPKVL